MKTGRYPHNDSQNHSDSSYKLPHAIKLAGFSAFYCKAVLKFKKQIRECSIQSQQYTKKAITGNTSTLPRF